LQTGEDPILKPQGNLYPSIHKHPLMPQESHVLGQWSCDMSDQNHEAHASDHGGSCVLDMTSARYSRWIYGLCCR